VLLVLLVLLVLHWWLLALVLPCLLPLPCLLLRPLPAVPPPLQAALAAPVLLLPSLDHLQHHPLMLVAQQQ
jgi:hypothetical protein